MAKKNWGVKARRQSANSVTVTTPSFYGTHSSMLVDPSTVTTDVTLAEDEVLAKDDCGYYITKTKYVDSNFADPNRYCHKDKRPVVTEAE